MSTWKVVLNGKPVALGLSLEAAKIKRDELKLTLREGESVWVAIDKQTRYH